MKGENSSLREQAEQSIRAKDYSAALDTLNNYINKFPDDLYGYIRKTVVLRFQKNYHDADILLECCLNMFYPDYLLLLVHSDTAMDLKDYGRASELLESFSQYFCW